MYILYIQFLLDTNYKHMNSRLTVLHVSISIPSVLYAIYINMRIVNSMTKEMRLRFDLW